MTQATFEWGRVNQIRDGRAQIVLETQPFDRFWVPQKDLQVGDWVWVKVYPKIYEIRACGPEPSVVE